MKIGIAGCGVIGGVMKKWLESYSPEHKLLVNDPPKSYNDDLSESDIVFINIHIPTEIDGTQNPEKLIKILNQNGFITFCNHETVDNAGMIRAFNAGCVFD